MASRLAEIHKRIDDNRLSKIMVVLLRLIVGATFVVSGFVKAIDPMGSVYKFQEYIAALNLTSLAGSEVVLAFAVPAIELTLGVMLITGCLRRATPLLLLLMMCVMLPLTYFLAVTDAVPDCGCFGDAFKLSNWQTFWKNVALTIGLIYLLLHNKSVPCIYGPIIQWIVMLLTLLLSLAISYVGYSRQPLIDFRPYKVGSHIGSHMQPVNENDFVFIYEKGGKQHEFSIDSVPDDEDGWNFVGRRKVTPDLSPAQKAALNAFSIYDSGTDVTDEVLDSTANQVLLLIPDLDKVNRAYAFVLNDIARACTDRGATLTAVTSSSQAQIESWTSLTDPAYPIYTGDDSEIKMLARGNPAIVYVEGGTIMWKRTFSSFPAKQLLSSNVPLARLSDDMAPSFQLWEMLWPYLLIMIALLFVNRIYPVVSYIVNKFKKPDSEGQ